jgi:RND family efflux transporter MFP subunit
MNPPLTFLNLYLKYTFDIVKLFCDNLFEPKEGGRVMQCRGRSYHPKKAFFLAVVILALLFPGAVNAGLSGPGAGSSPLVTVEPVLLQDISPPLKYVGHVEAVQTVDIQPRVSGYLVKVNYKEGDYVHESDLLYIIEREPYQAEVKANEAQVAAAKASLYKASQRLKRLRAALRESVPATQIDDTVAEKQMAEAKLKETQAQLELARINLGYTTIKAPITGLLGRTFFTKGNLVGPEKGPLARLVQIEPIRVVYSISERDLIALQKALAGASEDKESPLSDIRVRLPNGEIYQEAGKVDFIDNEVDTSTGTIAVRAIFQNHDHSLRPGEYVNVLVSQAKPQKMVVVPQSAILMDLQGRFVLVVDKDNRVRQQRVKTGPQIGTNWAIISGLSPGEKVIVEGIQKVRPGQVVKTITEKGKQR